MGNKDIITRGEKEGRALPSRYAKQERDLVDKYANIIGISPSAFQRIGAMILVDICDQLNTYGELEKFFQPGSFVTLRWAKVQKPFLNGSNLPDSAKCFFSELCETAEKKFSAKAVVQ